jgi:hypothetical protein
MLRRMGFSLALVALVIGVPSMAQEPGTARPQLLLREIVQEYQAPGCQAEKPVVHGSGRLPREEAAPFGAASRALT